MQRKIALVLIGVTIGGLERRILRLAEHLGNSPATKDRFILFVSQTIYEFCQRERVASVTLPIHVIPLRAPRLTYGHALRTIAALWKHRRSLFSVVTFESGFKIAWAIPPHLPLYCFVVNPEPFFEHARRWYYNVFIRLSFHRARRLDAITPFRRDYLLKTTSIGADRISVSPCSFIRPIETVDFDAKKRRIAWAGRLVASKQPLLFLEALRLLKDDETFRRYEVTIYGYGPQECEVKDILSDPTFPKNVSLTYEVNLAQALTQARLFVTTADNTNYGNQTLFEAMSAGCAVLATDVGDTALLVDEEVGLRVPNSAQGLADGLRRMLTASEENWLDWGKCARERVSTHNVENYTKHFLRVIEADGPAPRKIALVLLAVTIGGLERRLLRLAEHLGNNEATRDRFTLIISQTIYDFCQREQYAKVTLPIEVIPITAKKLTLIHALRTLRIIWRKKKELQSVVTFEGAFKVGWAIPPCLPLYCFVVNSEPFFERARLRIFNLFIRLTFRRAQRIDAISPYRKTYLLENTSLSSDKISVSPCSFIAPVKNVHFPEKRKRVIWAGRLVPSTQPLLFVESLCLLAKRAQLPDYEYAMHGDGPLKEEVARALQACGLDSRVTLAYEPKLLDALMRARIYVSTSEFTNYGNRTLFEAMAAGCAILATDTGDTNILVDSDVGSRVSNSAEGLAEGLRALVAASEEQCLKWSETARKRVEPHNIENYTNHFLKVINFQ